jgi:tungstate transport system substrate-binding protein
MTRSPTTTLRVLLHIVCLAVLLHAPAAYTDNRIVRLATTTSVDTTGLLEVLLPVFERASGYSVRVIAVGSGRALRLGREGDVDAVLVHDPRAEQEFMAAGHGSERRVVMQNDYILVGPQDDPAGIAGMDDAAAALGRIAVSASRFVSRGDESGTHEKELALWALAGGKPAGRLYVESGRGMGKVLLMAGELDAYTLTDRATWLKLGAKTPLRALVEGDARLHNPYSIIAVDPGKHRDVNAAGARELVEWITSPAGQGLIRDFHIGGAQLFQPREAR